MTIEPASLIVGLLAGALITTTFVYPRIFRIVAMVTAALLIAIGTGLLVWGILSVTGVEELRRMRFGPIIFSTSGQVLGWGGGCLAGGITALVLSFVGRYR